MYDPKPAALQQCVQALSRVVAWLDVTGRTDHWGAQAALTAGQQAIEHRTDQRRFTDDCPFCNRETPQLTTGMHERDASNEITKCLECGALKFGMTGEWESATPDS